MKPLTFTIYGQPATKKNSGQIIDVPVPHTDKRRKMVIPSAAYSRFEADSLKQITGAQRLHIDTPVNVKTVFFMQTRRAVDLSNLIEAAHDILVKAEVLMDDNRNIIASTDGSRVYWDKNNPRVEITITDAEPEYTQWDTKGKGVKQRESLLDHFPRAARQGR